jgi:pyruvate kinase
MFTPQVDTAHSTLDVQVLSTLADNGMNIARLNMTHGTHAWHSQVVQHIRRLNREKGWVWGLRV